MNILRTVASTREALDAVRSTSIIALVPTMGALHDGHVALFKTARLAADVVVASIFVNPTQFNDPADLAAYPRDEQRDAAISEAAGVDYIFAPDAGEMYGQDHATWVEVAGAAEQFEGSARPGHFRGVATVCLKLFTIVQPHIAFFGQKDAQQIAVVRQMVRDLNVPLDLRVVPTVRDHDGLALSSRNARLTPEERTRALVIPKALRAGLSAHRAGRDPAAAARAVLQDVDVEYADVANFGDRPTLVIAARVGRTRLIDNAPLDQEGL